MATMEISIIANNLGMNFDECLNILNLLDIEPSGNSVSIDDVYKLLDSWQDITNEKKHDKLESIVKHNTILIDTSEILSDRFPALMDHLEPLLLLSEKKLLIPSGVERELKNSFFRRELREKIYAVLKYLDTLITNHSVSICEWENEDSANQQILMIAEKSTENMAFITKDKLLTEKLLTMQGKAVYKIDRYGYLSNVVRSQKSPTSLREK